MNAAFMQFQRLDSSFSDMSAAFMQ